jgi:hypothetical protein
MLIKSSPTGGTIEIPDLITLSELLTVNPSKFAGGTFNAADFNSLADAIAYCSQFFGDVTLNIPGLHYTLTAPLNIRPRGRLSLAGSYSTTAASAASKTSGSAGAWAVAYVLANASSAVIGDELIIRAAVGTGIVEAFEGNYKITGISGNTVTVLHTSQNMIFPTAVLSSADVVIVHSVLNFTGCDGLRGFSSFQCDGVAIVGNVTAGTSGIITNYQGLGIDEQLSIGVAGGHVCVRGFEVGLLAQFGNTIDFQDGSVSDCLTYGALGQHVGSIFIHGGVANSNRASGVAADNASDISGTNMHACCNGTYGVYPFSGGAYLGTHVVIRKNVLVGLRLGYGATARLGVNDAIVSDNDDIGIECLAGSTLYCQGATIQNNGGNGLQATYHSFVYALEAVITGSGAHDISVAEGGDVAINNGQVNDIFALSGGSVNVNGATGLITLSPPLNKIKSDGTRIYNGALFTSGSPMVPSYTVVQLASITATAGAYTFCTDEIGGAVLVFGDGTNWRRVTDRAIVS